MNRDFRHELHSCGSLNFKNIESVVINTVNNARAVSAAANASFALDFIIRTKTLDSELDRATLCV